MDKTTLQYGCVYAIECDLGPGENYQGLAEIVDECIDNSDDLILVELLGGDDAGDIISIPSDSIIGIPTDDEAAGDLPFRIVRAYSTDTIEKELGKDFIIADLGQDLEGSHWFIATKDVATSQYNFFMDHYRTQPNQLALRILAILANDHTICDRDI